ncbi:MAG: hypothetical protein ACJ73S_28720 [Mycobacteriales bacterium]
MSESQYAVPLGDPAVLLEAINRVSAVEGVAVEVLGGVVDRERDRVAWIERHAADPDWIGVRLNLAGDGTGTLPRIGRRKPRVSVDLVPDRDDKVTGVEYLRFFDDPRDCLIVVYEWAGGGRRLCRLTLRAPGLHGVQSHWVDLDGDAAVVIAGEDWWDPPTVWCLRETYPRQDGLVHGLRLPDLTPRVPIPAPRPGGGAAYGWQVLAAGGAGTIRWTERLADEGVLPEWRDGDTVELRLPGDEQDGFVDDPRLVWEPLRVAIGGGAPPDGPDILIGALAVPFWDPTGPVSPGDEADEIWEVRQGPWWFPAAWQRYLRAPVAEGGAGREAEAAAWLAWLDRLDGEAAGEAAGSGWDPDWSREEGAVRFALTHLRRQAGVLAAACRAGEVPELGDWGTWRRPPALAAAPAGFARAWRALPERFLTNGTAG